MKGLSQRKVFVVLILTMAVWICLLLGMRVQSMMCEGVYVLSLQREDHYFSSDDLSGIGEEEIELTFTQPVYPEVSNGFRREEAEVFLTNENYAYIANTYMQSGAFLNGAQVRKGLSVAVLSEGAARRLFGNQECVGESVYLNGVSFQVVGIMKEQGAETARIYIPYSTMEYIGVSELKTRQLWCRFSNQVDALAVMKKTGCSVEEIRILQMDSLKNIFWQRFDLPLILTGAYMIFRVCRKAAGRVKGAALILFMIGVCTGIMLLWKLAAVSWCVPSGYELLGKNWKDMIYSVLDFYLLVDVKIDNMLFLTHWNVISLFFMMVYLYLFSVEVLSC